MHNNNNKYNNNNNNNKGNYSNIGHLIALVSVCEDVKWQEINICLLQETFIRQVLWLCRDIPELENLNYFNNYASLEENKKLLILEKIFKFSSTSRNLLSFHCCFLRATNSLNNVKLNQLASNYDKTL